MELTKYPIDQLVPASYNPRKDLTPDDKEYKKIKRSIEEFGYVDPIIINHDSTIIGGHQRLKVLRDLGYTEVDAIKINIDKTKEKALNVALNKIAGEWDIDKLGVLIDELKTIDYNVELTGFDLSELDNILTNMDELDDSFVLKDGDRAPLQTMSLTFSDEQVEVINEAITKMKQSETYKMYEDEINQNSNGNALFLVVSEWLSLKN